MNDRHPVPLALRHARIRRAARSALVVAMCGLCALEASAQRARPVAPKPAPKTRARPRPRVPSAAERKRLEKQAREDELAARRARDGELAEQERAAYSAVRARLDAARAEVAAAEQAIVDDKDERRDEFVILPNASYSPETAVMAGAYVAYLRHLGDPDETRPSTFDLNFAATTKRQFFAELGASLWLLRDVVTTRAGVAAEIFPNTYYGIGRNTTVAQAEDYTARDIAGDVGVMLRIIGAFYVGARGSLDIHEIVDKEPGRELAGGRTAGSRGGTTSTVGPAMALDTRDNVYETRMGTYLDVGYEVAAPWLGSDFRFGRMKADARQFVPVRSTTIALQLLAEATTGTVPFYLLPSMGGDALRGVFYGRFRDRVLVQAQAEYRFPIVWRFRGAAFFGAGHVGRAVTDFDIAGVVPAGGIGLRYTLIPAERVNIRLDVAYAAEGLQYYLNIGEAF